MKIKIGLYGTNGHQIHKMLEDHPYAQLVATAAFDLSLLPPALRASTLIKHYTTLDEMLRDKEVELVSLCSPRRRDQASEAIRCLEAGKHVYAEKPCAMTEEDLDAIIDATHRTGMKFHEMAGTAFEQPYYTMRSIIQDGTIGTVVQVFAQKSYPYHDGRPQDEDIDGGLICQNAVHAFRFIEHVACRKIKNIYAIETGLGNPRNGGLKMAASFMAALDNGGVASIIANYLNPKGFGLWGNEHLRIFGTKGFIETTDGGTKTRLIVGDKDFGSIDAAKPVKNYFDMYIDSLLGRDSMPLSLDDELHPTRMVIRAKKGAISNE